MYFSFYGGISSFDAASFSFYSDKNYFGGVYFSFYGDRLDFYGVLGGRFSFSWRRGGGRARRKGRAESRRGAA